MKQNKKPKQTLESAQYGLEINFIVTDQIVQERNQQTESLQCTTVEQHLKYKSMSYLH